jgi:hypothetical protein
MSLMIATRSRTRHQRKDECNEGRIRLAGAIERGRYRVSWRDQGVAWKGEKEHMGKEGGAG